MWWLIGLCILVVAGLYLSHKLGWISKDTLEIIGLLAGIGAFIAGFAPLVGTLQPNNSSPQPTAATMATNVAANATSLPTPSPTPLVSTQMPQPSATSLPQPTATSTEQPTATETPQPLATSTLLPTATLSATAIPVGQPIRTNIENYIAQLVSVEINSTGTMLWNFEFWNKSSSPQRLTIDGKATYVVDDLGNRYAALDVPADESFPPGVAEKRTLEFERPKPGATSFTLYLIRYHLSQVEFATPSFTLPIALNTNPIPTPTNPPSNVRVIPVDLMMPTNVKGYLAKVLSIELQPSGRMVWNIEFWNQTSSDQRLTIDGRNTYVVDNLGNQYPALYVPPDKYYQAGVREQHVLEFESPNSDATELTLYLTRYHLSEIEFNQPLGLDLP